MSFPNIYASSPQPAQSTYSLFDPKTSQYLDDAENFASNIVDPFTSVAAVRAIKESRVSTAYYILGAAAYNWTNSFNHYESQTRYLNDNCHPVRGMMIRIACIVKELSCEFVGQIVKSKACIENTLNYLGSLKSKMEFESQNHPQHPHLKAIRKIIDCEQTIFKKMEEILEIKVALLVSAAVAGAFILLGVLAFSKSILAIGAMIGFGTALVFIFNTSYKHGEQSISVHAKTMLVALECLKNGNNIIYSTPLSNACGKNPSPSNDFMFKTGGNESLYESCAEASDASKTHLTNVQPVSINETQNFIAKCSMESQKKSYINKETSIVSLYPTPV